MDYLAEVTLSIMMRQKLKNPQAGYATDFLDFVRRALPQLVAKNVKVVTNAGGLNPSACRAKIFEIARELGISGLRVGVVEGDDLLARLPELVAAGHPLANMDTGEPIAGVLVPRHLGQRLPRRPAGRRRRSTGGAQIVLCGRITDTALALGPLVHEFGWAADDWDRLAAGTIAGHILECGAQATGGNFTRFWEVPDLWNVGYPIAEVGADGSVHGHQAPGHRRAGHGRHRLRAAGLRDGRPVGLHHARRHRRLHARSGSRRRDRTACGSPASAAAPTRRSSRSRPPTSTATRRAGR